MTDLDAGRPRIVCAIHGILTRVTAPSWCDAFDSWMWSRDPRVRVVKREYVAAPVPMWNVWIKNRILARALCADVMALLSDHPGAIVHMLAHSNGACIALRAARMLSDAGAEMGALVLAGAACSEDADRSGALDLLGSGAARRLVAYCSTDDWVTYSRLIWPYGRLGFFGWRLRGAVYSQPGALETRWFAGGHNGYFRDSTARAHTFEAAARDMGILEG
ncbi:MAG: hypothetical protein IT577_23805 [Verrucomicrobiae bacterium]|nr:hypothetical protein [Verrucomicrobiae bacterium]